MTGSVSHTGSSSLEVRMSAQCEGFSCPFVEATFVFVARDTRPKPGAPKGSAWPVSALVPQTPQEIELFSKAEARVAHRKAVTASAAGDAAGQHSVSCVSCCGWYLKCADVFRRFHASWFVFHL
jgi:hypothetical protein